MTTRARARIGALALAITIAAPVALSTAVFGAIDPSVEPDAETLFGFASLVVGVAAVASLLGLFATLAYTQEAPRAASDSVITLRILSVLRACADGATFAVLFTPGLQVWQTSAAIAIVEVVFFASLLRYTAHVFDAHGNGPTARSTRQFVFLYCAMRLAVLLVWAFPDVKMISLSHRALAPLLDGVVAFLLLRAAGLLGNKPESPPHASAEPPT